MIEEMRVDINDVFSKKDNIIVKPNFTNVKINNVYHVLNILYYLIINIKENYFDNNVIL